MAIGKRKRQSTPDETTVDFDKDALELFRRHFEARFKPLPELSTHAAKVEAVVIAPDDELSEWEGLDSDDEEDLKVQIVEHSTVNDVRDSLSRAEMKAFMSSKPPIAAAKPPPDAQQKPTTDADEADEVANLKNDVALQRLLKESHLLDPSTSFSPSGINRHKALDLRLQSLGSKGSVFAQEKMPMSHRRGMIAKASMKEEKRRREAKENGIILEKAVKTKKVGTIKRERGVGGPSVGKFKGGMLKLSRRDVATIEGPKTGARHGKTGKR